MTSVSQPEEDVFESAEDRELRVAYEQGLANMQHYGEVLDDDEIEAFRSAL